MDLRPAPKTPAKGSPAPPLNAAIVAQLEHRTEQGEDPTAVLRSLGITYDRLVTRYLAALANA